MHLNCPKDFIIPKCTPAPGKNIKGWFLISGLIQVKFVGLYTREDALYTGGGGLIHGLTFKLK